MIRIISILFFGVLAWRANDVHLERTANGFAGGGDADDDF